MLALRVHRATQDHRALKAIKVHRVIRVQLAQRDQLVLLVRQAQLEQKATRAIRA